MELNQIFVVSMVEKMKDDLMRPGVNKSVKIKNMRTPCCEAAAAAATSSHRHFSKKLVQKSLVQ